MIRTDDCICAIPAKPPVEHPRECPVRQRYNDQYAAEERERERQGTVHCPHCGTSGVWTYSGVIGPWSTGDGKQLTEFSETLRWTGTHELGQEHTPERCIAALKTRLALLEPVVNAACLYVEWRKALTIDVADAHGYVKRLCDAVDEMSKRAREGSTRADIVKKGDQRV